MPMAVSSQPSRESLPALDQLLREAGALFSSRCGRTIVANYGSAAGELAVCVAAVGIVDRRELAQLVIEGPEPRLAAALAAVTETTPGHELSMPVTGGAVRANGAWVCRLGPRTAVMICEPPSAAAIASRLAAQSGAEHALTVSDRSLEFAAIEVLGPNTNALLRTLGVFGVAGDPKRVAPFTASDAGGVQALWLLESDRSALALMPSESAAELWGAIEGAGRPFGVSCVGTDAAERYALLDRGLRALRAGL
jgi:glycine cleavage system aminomethyltransferase T